MSDDQYPTYRHLFALPTLASLNISSDEHPAVYLCGNSLGLMPLSTPAAIGAELEAWRRRAVEAHFRAADGATPWMDIDLPVVPLLAPLVGAQDCEVALTGSLTANLNALLISFYRPAGRKTKILFERHAFPSDYYAFLNLVKLHGLDETHLIHLEPRPGRHCLETADILAAITEHADEVNVVCLPGVQYYTGQWFDIAAITAHARHLGITVGWDLAHAVGNVPLELHRWDVDFAAWCLYKYLNAGPGAMAGLFVHQRHTCRNSKSSFAPRLAGWWGNRALERFKMLEEFDPIPLALLYRQLNPSVIDVVSVRLSLEVFAAAGGVAALRQKSVALTRHLETLLRDSPYCGAALGYQIITPQDPQARGAQLSLLFGPHHDDPARNVMERVFAYLRLHGVICDERRPDVIRIAPAPLYNTFAEVETAVRYIHEALTEIKTE